MERRGDLREEMGKEGGDGKMEGGKEMGRKGRIRNGRRREDGKGWKEESRWKLREKGWKGKRRWEGME